MNEHYYPCLTGTDGDGFVRLCAYMQPIPEEIHAPRGTTGVLSDIIKVVPDDWHGDLEIVRNARVSYNADWRAGAEEGSDQRILKYMFEHQHTSPFEAMVFTFEIKCPLAIARQWQRHRTWSYNEISARYTRLEEGFYVPDTEDVGVQHATNKQASDFSQTNDAAVDYVRALYHHSVEGFKRYDEALRLGIPRERARFFLGTNTYTRFFGTVDLHNLMHFIRLRYDNHAQWEIQQYGAALLELIKPIVPETAAMLEDEVLNGTDIEQLLKSIMKDGNVVLDGKTRELMLKLAKKHGVEI